MPERAPVLGDRLRQLRAAAGLSRERLAERAGVSADAIAALESGRRRRPRAATLARLADALGVGRPELVAASLEPSAAPEPARLPLELTSFVGRGRELALLGRALAATRLLTLAGPGGIGKSRLALVLAAAAAGRGEEARFVALDACADPALVAGLVAAALDGEGSGDLLLLDTCDHVLPGVQACVRELLAARPRLRLLATSRTPLEVPGELVWRVPPLRPAEAVRLFVERARQVDPAFGLDAATAGPVAEVCRRLEGVPLAVELAAARVRVLTPAQLVDRLDDALGGSAAARRLLGRPGDTRGC